MYILTVAQFSPSVNLLYLLEISPPEYTPFIPNLSLTKVFNLTYLFDFLSLKIVIFETNY